MDCICELWRPERNYTHSRDINRRSVACVSPMTVREPLWGVRTPKALIYDMHSGRVIRSLPPNPGAVTAVLCTDNDDFLITVGGNKITFYSFRNEDSFAHLRTKKRKASRHISAQKHQYNVGNVPVTCFDISRDSQLAAVASGRSVAIWQLNTPEVATTYNYHTGPVTTVSFSPNGEFVVSGSEDKSVIVVGLALGLVVTTFKGHAAIIHSVCAMMDSRRILSADRDGLLCVWLADSATLLQTVQGPYKHLAVTNNMKFAVCTNGDNNLRIWSLTREDEKYNVSHSDEITCFVITVDSLFVITGSRDMSLKVWQATGGKLAQVLVGHTDAVTCVAVPVTNKNQVISGSKDCNLIVWDLHTGEELHTLAGHLAQVTCVKISADGTTAVSASDDKTLIVWETKRGLALTSLQLHVPFTRFDISIECSSNFVLFGALTAASPFGLQKANIGEEYGFEIVADFDKKAVSDDKKNTYVSDIRIGTLDITFEKKNYDVVTRYAYKGRGAELSELLFFNGKMYTFDDKTGIISDITNHQLVPWVILGDGAGNETNGFKCEWATIKDDHIYVGSVGVENYDDDDKLENRNNFFVKKVSKTGEVIHENWYDIYDRIRNTLGCYVVANQTKKWIFLPRKCSEKSYVKADVDATGCNKMIITSEDFSTIEYLDIQATPLQKERGFSSFKFVPDSQESMIVGLTTVENGKTINTAIIGLDLQGKILYPETKIFNDKYEGVAFLKHFDPKNIQMPNLN
uniref:Putative apyrase n=1 Tax=Lutzomyia longipalpis TaxID=7200 RepID=A0A7G3A859_LUTLO